MKMLICDPTNPKAIKAMQEAGIEVEVRDDITLEELEEIIPGYHAIVVRSRTEVQAPLIDKATDLKLVIRGGVGVDSIDVQRAHAKGIEVHNTPFASSNAVAELTIGYIFALARQIPQMTASMKAGHWEKKAFSKGMEVVGKTLGLIGCGRIGSLVAQRCLALRMAVLYYCLPPFPDIPGATRVSLEELITRSDFISLHIPYNDETHHILGAEEFAKMKDGVHIINCGRGGTLDEAALYDALASGKVAGAALDVFEDEKTERGQHLLALPQVIGSPHIGAGTVEAEARVGDEVAQIAVHFARHH